MSMAITYMQARQLTIDRLQQRINTEPESELERPQFMVGFNSYTINSMMAEVMRGTPDGRAWVNMTAKSLNYLVEV